ncbi:MAG TPA: hypothetical protein VHF22_08310, partial [Planctomycetota bacterium]|nr:hypothetical protein [Planctomycetota bacterium]
GLTYLPVRCAEVGAVAGETARALRTLRLSPDVEALLDEIDIYGAELTVTAHHVEAFSASFEVVIIPGAIRTPNLIFLAEALTTRVVILEWGDVGGVVFHSEYAVAAKRPTVRIAVAYRDFCRDSLHLPLGLPELPAIDPTATDGKANLPTCVAVASRLTRGAGCYSREHLRAALDGVRARDARLLLLGKDHHDARFLWWYWRRWKRIDRRVDLSRLELLSQLRSATALLYWLREPAVLQYVALECAALGTPVIYWADTLLSRYMPITDSCRVTAGSQIGPLIRELSEATRARSVASQQGKALRALTEDTIEKWAKLLALA